MLPAVQAQSLWTVHDSREVVEGLSPSWGSLSWVVQLHQNGDRPFSIPGEGQKHPRFSLASRHNFTLPCRTWNNRRARCDYCTGTRPKNEGLGRPPTAVRREKNRVIKDAMWGMHLCRRAGVASMAFLRIDCGNLEPKVGVPVCWPPSLDTPRRPSSCCNTTASSHKMGRAFQVGVKSTHRSIVAIATTS